MAEQIAETKKIDHPVIGGWYLDYTNPMRYTYFQIGERDDGDLVREYIIGEDRDYDEGRFFTRLDKADYGLLTADPDYITTGAWYYNSYTGGYFRLEQITETVTGDGVDSYEFEGRYYDVDRWESRTITGPQFLKYVDNGHYERVDDEIAENPGELVCAFARDRLLDVKDVHSRSTEWNPLGVEATVGDIEDAVFVYGALNDLL